MLKVTEELLKELIHLEEIVKTATKRISEIKEVCRLKGSFATQRYVCAVQEITRQSVVGAPVLIAKLGQETVDELELIREITYQTVRVSAKGLVHNESVS